MRITSKGQVTIPKWVRDEAGLSPGSEVDFEIEDGAVRLHAQPSKGEELVGHLRRHRDGFTMSTEEIMGLTRSED